MCDYIGVLTIYYKRYVLLYLKDISKNDMEGYNGWENILYTGIVIGKNSL